MNKLLSTGFLSLIALAGTQSDAADAAKSQLYHDLVVPVLNAKCAGCHGEEKPKGKLRVDSLEAILKGGNEGPSVVAGKVDESPLIQRVYLPIGDDEHMPPENKEQLTEQETAVIAFWIQSGAKDSGTVAELKADEKTLAAANHVLANLPKAKETAVAKADAPKTDPAMEKLVAETIGRVEKGGASLMAIAQDTPELRFSALNVSKDFSDDRLAELKPIAAQIKWIDLARTPVTDKGLAHLSEMTNLTRLHLENTGITDAGLDALKGLERLEYLNLYGTQVSDAGLQKL
ncbi:MAG TPA: ribonuclease inhibitor, partial [Bacteroidia bacterium]|nr:ribonuclease inhibitor [Bacteroidia bacterium]